MDLVSTSKRSPRSLRRSGKLCAQPSDVDTSAAAADEVEAACREARLDRIESCTSRSFIVCPSLHDSVGLAPPHPYRFAMHSSAQGRFHVCAILRIDPVSDLRSLLCLVPKQALGCGSGMVRCSGNEAVPGNLCDLIHSKAKLASPDWLCDWSNHACGHFDRPVRGTSPPSLRPRSLASSLAGGLARALLFVSELFYHSLEPFISNGTGTQSDALDQFAHPLRTGDGNNGHDAGVWVPAIDQKRQYFTCRSI